MENALPLLVFLLSVNDPLVGFPSEKECEDAQKTYCEWKKATERRLEFSYQVSERRRLQAALAEGNTRFVIWHDLYMARCNWRSRPNGIHYADWLRAELGEHRWRLRAMPTIVPWEWAD